MKIYLMILVTLFSSIVLAKEPIRIAIVDSGISTNLKVPLCPGLSKDFTGNNSLEDNVGHGTIISTLIHVFALKANYCQVVLRVFDKKDMKQDKFGQLGFVHSFQNMKSAIMYANSIKVQVVNLSVGGPGRDNEEYETYQRLLDKKVHVINAAGNEGKDLDKDCSWFPGCYDSRIVMVGNLGPDNKPNSSSNYGQRVNAWIPGTNIKINDQIYTGTSLSAAMLSGAVVKLLDDNRN